MTLAPPTFRIEAVASIDAMRDRDRRCGQLLGNEACKSEREASKSKGNASEGLVNPKPLREQRLEVESS